MIINLFVVVIAIQALNETIHNQIFMQFYAYELWCIISLYIINHAFIMNLLLTNVLLLVILFLLLKVIIFLILFCLNSPIRVLQP